MTYREYAALVEYWWGVHRYAAELEYAEVQRRRAERLPEAIREEDWYVHTYRVWNAALGSWDSYRERRCWR